MERYFFWIALSEVVGGISAWITRRGMAAYNAAAIKPALSPPPIVFGIVWPILYLLMGFGMARAEQNSSLAKSSMAKSIFLFQLAMNFCWSILFFNLNGYGFSLIWLIVMWAAVILMAKSFYSLDKTAGLTQIPYVIWILFAIYLNFCVWRLN